MAIIGGGIAGLTSAIALSKAGRDVILFEKNKYPFHKVCGEYLSREVINFLSRLDIDFNALKPVQIKELHFSSPGGIDFTVQLKSGGLGISRYQLDHYLFQKAIESGCECVEDQQIDDVEFTGQSFKLRDRQKNEYESRLCLGSFGKRTSLDRKLDRAYFTKKTGYVGVKRHYRGEFPLKRVGLHNFIGGYCGISNIEEGKVNVCYLTSGELIKKAGGIEPFEKNRLRSNPHIRSFLDRAEPIFETPVVVSQMYFGTKELIRDHILMLGDAAGAISPLTGNGMAMAVHSTAICHQLVLDFLDGNINRNEMESAYQNKWTRTFQNRINWGNTLHSLFGRPMLSDILVGSLRKSPKMVQRIIGQTHGSPF